MDIVIIKLTDIDIVTNYVAEDVYTFWETFPSHNPLTTKLFGISDSNGEVDVDILHTQKEVFGA